MQRMLKKKVINAGFRQLASDGSLEFPSHIDEVLNHLLSNREKSYNLTRIMKRMGNRAKAQIILCKQLENCDEPE